MLWLTRQLTISFDRLIPDVMASQMSDFSNCQLQRKTCRHLSLLFLLKNFGSAFKSLERLFIHLKHHFEELNVTNEQVVDLIGEKRTLVNNILCRKANWIGHILRKNCLLYDDTEEIGRAHV